MNNRDSTVQSFVSRHLLFVLIGASAMGTVSCGEKTIAEPNPVAVSPTIKANLTSTPSPKEKFALLLSKAEAGDADAQLNVGMYYLYYKTEEVERDTGKALEWLSKSATQGNPKAQTQLAYLYTKKGGMLWGKVVAEDVRTAIKWYEKAVAQGHATAQNGLGDIYFFGRATEKDFVKAFQLYQLAANQGDSDGEANLANMYANGKGVARNAKKAVDLYKKAASQGHTRAAFNLGQIYYFAQGIPKDTAVAARYFEESAKQGEPDAAFSIGYMYANGEGVPKDGVMAVKWLRKSAILGDSQGQGWLARMYMSGDGVPQDLILGYAWANLAAANGDATDVSIRNTYEKFFLNVDDKAEAQRLSAKWTIGKDIFREKTSITSPSENTSTSGALSKRGTGTAFFVNTTGQMITNHHVINGCSEVRVTGRMGVANLQISDVTNDLALLKISDAVNTTATISSEPSNVRQSDDIVVFGFPLNSVLSSGGNLTPGVVSALTGLGNNTNQIQITAPIQPGSSGSPVMNTKGEIMGVVSMKLSDSKMAKETGQVAQNVNFAVSGQTLKSFLDAHKVEYTTGHLFMLNKSTADLADQARKWTTVVECWK